MSTDDDKRAAQVLLAAAELLKDGAWTQWTSARDADGKELNPRDPAAVQWCAVGAIRRVEPDAQVVDHASFLVRRHIRARSIPGWNDRDGMTAKKVRAKMREVARRYGV